MSIELKKTPEEIEAMSTTDIAYLAAMLKIYPTGEDAMDIRFQVLRKDLAELLDYLSYAVYKAAGNKPKKPKQLDYKKFEIFSRFTRKKENDFRNLDQAEIARRMRMVGKGMAK